MNLEERAKHSGLHSQARRAAAKTQRRARRIRRVFTILAAVGLGLLISQVTASDPIPVVVIAGVLLLIPLASVPARIKL